MRAGKTAQIILLVLAAAVLASAVSHLRTADIIKREYGRLYSVFREYLRAEEGMFNALSLRLDETKWWLSWGQSPKLILSDQLGQKWIFKPCIPQQRDLPALLFSCSEKFTAVAVYRLYKILGVATPRTAVVNLRINGKVLSGSLQEYIPNEDVLQKKFVPYLSPEACLYLHKTYFLDWIFSNVDFNLTNFIVVLYKNYIFPQCLMRLDNGLSFLPRRHCHFCYEIDGPVKFIPSAGIKGSRPECSNNAYYWFWDAYINGWLEYKTASASGFIRFVEGFPENYLRDIIHYTGVPQVPFSADSTDFRNYLHKVDSCMGEVFKRKNYLVADAGRFHRGIARLKKERYFPSRNNPSGVLMSIQTVTRGLTAETERLRRQAEALRILPRYSPDIEAVFSLEGMMEVRKVYRAYTDNAKKDELKAVASSALENLEKFERSAFCAAEKKALKNYIKEVTAVLNGGEPGQGINTINRIIDPAEIP